ncbi:MAG TPA: hypothetical protein VK821_16735 [Dehalococcoidia bacterium]|nr:hypothetical protein [Dehalococcoidia bacterium]
MNIRNHARTLVMASTLALGVCCGPTGQIHVDAQPNNDDGIELDCPLSGNWVANGGYVIAKDAHGVYHRVFCVDGQWVDGGPILSYLTTQSTSALPIASPSRSMTIGKTP